MSKKDNMDNMSDNDKDEILEKDEAPAEEMTAASAGDNDAEEAAEEADEETAEEEAGDEEESAFGAVSGKPSVPVDESEKASNAEFRKLPLIEKCKRDPMIPVAVLLAFVAVIVAAVYFMLPNAKTPTMGIELSEFIQRFNNGAVASSLLQSGADIGFRTPPYVDPDSKPSIMGDKAIITASRSYADFFAGPSKYFIAAGIEGATRKNDNTLSYVRIWVQYSDLSDDADFNSVWMYFSNTLNALYPDMSVYEAMGVAMQKMGEFDGDPRFYVREDYAFRLVPVQKEDTTYIVVDVVPKYILNDSQIRDVLIPGATVNESETVSASVPEST
ncbi:MAG: hypothetical protein IKG03_00165 [Clostridiales bacterium]|nr:hypothetical protein [Clostridiales bacterium]